MSNVGTDHPAVCTCGAIQPKFADRQTLAKIISALYFPVTPRTIRTWPLAVWHPNKKAVHLVEEALAYAEAKVNESPASRQGR